MISTRSFAFATLAAVVSLAPLAMADEWSKRTLLTVKESIQLPDHTVLAPGSYTFKLLDSTADRHIVQVFDKDGMHLITTVLAIPNYRLQPTGDSQFTFWEMPAGQPPAMRAWFYPGDNFGQEFVYPKNLSTQIAATAKADVPTTAAQSADEYRTAPITATNQSGASSSLNSNTYRAPAPRPAPPPAPVEQPREVAAAAPPPVQPPAEAPVDLPHTASSVPLIGLAGLVSMLGFFALRGKRVR